MCCCLLRRLQFVSATQPIGVERRCRISDSEIDTITSDNGKVFARHEAIAKALGADFYFVHPYVSLKGVLNENTHGLIRLYFLKGCDLATIFDEDIQCLGMKTPNQIFFRINPAVALAS